MTVFNVLLYSTLAFGGAIILVLAWRLAWITIGLFCVWLLRKIDDYEWRHMTPAERVAKRAHELAEKLRQQR